jgi:hypothetical protein
MIEKIDVTYEQMSHNYTQCSLLTLKCQEYVTWAFYN